MASGGGGFFSVLQDDDSSSDESGDNEAEEEEEGAEASKRTSSGTITTGTHQQNNKSSALSTTFPQQKAGEAAAAAPVSIPSYAEDLSVSRADEVTVLEAVYGPDFARKTGVWGCARLEVQTRPPDVEPERIGSEVLLSVQLGKYYPYVAPAIELRQVRGLSQDEQGQLLALLQERASDLATSGCVMVSELVQTTEDFLIEHNRDPTMSAWEQMKAREKTEREQEENVQRELSRLMNTSSSERDRATSPVHSVTRSTTLNDGSSSEINSRNKQIAAANVEATADVERELQRQREALQAAQRPRGAPGTPLTTLRRDSSAIEDDDDDDDDDEIDFDADEPDDAGIGVSAGASRYKTDFIELGVLGRGGGGEVVKVRNRLDRRVYAIKKILLESESGRSAKFGAIQNRKLRREVTTISRMTHQFIVRYYQAWVEGASDTIPEEDSTQVVSGALEVIDDDESSEENSSESSSSSGAGWWKSNTDTKHDRASGSSNRRPSWNAKQSLGDETSNDDTSAGLSSQKLHSAAMLNLLEQEHDQAFHSPLLTGLGFQNQAYQNILDNPTKEDLRSQSMESEVDDIWDESSVKVTGMEGSKILYIQMQYCATTLRKLIDERAVESMADNEVWRLVRQMLEALAYIHSRNIIVSLYHDLLIYLLVTSSDRLTFQFYSSH